MVHYHAVLWIDHHEAHGQSFTRDETGRTFIETHGKHRQMHHRKGSSMRGAFSGVADRMLP